MPIEIDDALKSDARLAALRRTSLLDSPPEEAFDRLTRLATTVLRVPAALVSLVDRDRQFFKSCVGLPEPLASTRQTPLTHSFCKHAVDSSRPFVVADAREHPLVQDNPAVSELGVIAYAGVPLITPEGLVLGTFCVVDAEPHAWTEEEIAILQDLAASVMTEIGLRRLAEELNSVGTDLQELVKIRTSQLRRSEERQRVLLEVNNAIISSLTRASLFGAVAEALRRVLPYDLAALMLYDAQQDAFKVNAVEGALPPTLVGALGSAVSRRGSHVGWVFDNGRPLLRRDLRTERTFDIEEKLLAQGVRSFIVVPLLVRERVIGTMNVASTTPERYSEEDASLLFEAAKQIALAVENMLAYEEITELKVRLERENLYLQEEVRSESAFGDVIGESPSIMKVLENVKKVATTDSTVLVTGETGTGKELVVRAIHTTSRRKSKILVKVNCAALPGGVIESELFGHEKGAFTGALGRKIGRFELADGGTLFLDEIGDLPTDLQAKLLRVLQDGEFERVGGTHTLKVDVRLIAATNRDLERMVQDQRFRADLFYRLNVFPISIPPLRERPTDIPALVRHFVMIYATKMGKGIGRIPSESMQRLLEYDWPGNVRELQNVIERAVILSSKSQLELGDPLEASGAANGRKKRPTLEEIEREHIVSVLESTGWRVSGGRGAAGILGMKRTTLEARMKKLGIVRGAAIPR